MNKNVGPEQRVVAALRSMFVGDSLAMPVHWYYRTADIFRQFPAGITRLEAAPESHPSSIMSLHSTHKGGRGSHGNDAQQHIVGDVILKGRRKFWGRASQHYHQGMQAGENTLNAHCARVTMRALIANAGHYDKDGFIDAYVSFMTADPPQHGDTYAESYHRGFFANLATGKTREQCGAVTHDTPSIGGLVTIAPVFFAERLRATSLTETQAVCRQHLWLTHPDKALAGVCDEYCALLNGLLFREADRSARDIIATFAMDNRALDLPRLTRQANNDSDVIGKLFSSACYISDSFPGVLYLAYKYHADLRTALLVNANLGGDNVHRGMVLGVLLGLVSGETESEFYGSLIHRAEIESEIMALLTTTNR